MSPADKLFSQLADLVEGRLDPEQAAGLRARIAADPQAAADLAWLEATIGLLRSDAAEGVDAPDHVVNRALRLIGPLAPAAPQVGLLQRIVAVLRFDSRHQALAPGMRSDTAQQRHLLYTADTCDIDLRITADGNTVRVSGQILGSDETGTVTARGASATVQALLNDLSEFTLPPVPTGVYTLIVRLDTLELVIEGLELST